MSGDREDKSQVGLTAVGDEAMATLVGRDKPFGTQIDAYRFAIAYAVAADLDIESAPQTGYQTKFNALGTLEFGSAIRDLFQILEVGEPGRPYATAEKLAEIGVRSLVKRFESGATLIQILDELNSGAEDEPTVVAEDASESS